MGYVAANMEMVHGYGEKVVDLCLTKLGNS